MPLGSGDRGAQSGMELGGWNWVWWENMASSSLAIGLSGDASQGSVCAVEFWKTQGAEPKIGCFNISHSIKGYHAELGLQT